MRQSAQPEVSLRLLIVEADEHEVWLGGRRRRALAARVGARERLDLDEQPESGVRKVRRRWPHADADVDARRRAGGGERVRVPRAGLAAVALLRFGHLLARLLVLRAQSLALCTQMRWREREPHAFVSRTCQIYTSVVGKPD